MNNKKAIIVDTNVFPHHTIGNNKNKKYTKIFKISDLYSVIRVALVWFKKNNQNVDIVIFKTILYECKCHKEKSTQDIKEDDEVKICSLKNFFFPDLLKKTVDQDIDKLQNDLKPLKLLINPNENKPEIRFENIKNIKNKKYPTEVKDAMFFEEIKELVKNNKYEEYYIITKDKVLNEVLKNYTQDNKSKIISYCNSIEFNSHYDSDYRLVKSILYESIKNEEYIFDLIPNLEEKLEKHCNTYGFSNYEIPECDISIEILRLERVELGKMKGLFDVTFKIYLENEGFKFYFDWTATFNLKNNKIELRESSDLNLPTEEDYLLESKYMFEDYAERLGDIERGK